MLLLNYVLSDSINTPAVQLHLSKISLIPILKKLKIEDISVIPNGETDNKQSNKFLMIERRKPKYPRDVRNVESTKRSTRRVNIGDMLFITNHQHINLKMKIMNKMVDLFTGSYVCICKSSVKVVELMYLMAGLIVGKESDESLKL